MGTLAIFSAPCAAQENTPVAQPPAAQPPAPPSDVQATDHPNDTGKAIDLVWKLSPDDKPEADPQRVVKYEILRSTDAEAGFVVVGESSAGEGKFEDAKCEPKQLYYYRVVAVGPEGVRSTAAATDQAVAGGMEYFDTARSWFGVILVLMAGAVVLFIALARSGLQLKVRKIAGLSAFEDAVGRATETGRSCLFVPGIQDLNDIQTVAGLTVLAHVAKTAAEYDAHIEVPTSRSLVMTAARETVESAFLAAGRPDAYNEDMVYYLTDEQFGYVADVSGKMVRERPAACFYMGSFFAESLILAETGNSIGAIQVAGTAQPAQLPFFVAACDYTLIGEELFAASAYLSGEPDQLGSLKGQDVGKMMVGALVLVGSLLATVEELHVPLGQWAHDAFEYLTEVILT